METAGNTVSEIVPGGRRFLVRQGVFGISCPIESDTVAHGFELVECPSLGSFGVEAGEVICAGVVVEGSGVADVLDGRRGVLVDQVQVHPGQERVVLGEPAGQCVGQGRDFRPESTPEPVWDIQASNLARIRQGLWLRATTRCCCP